MGLFDFIQGYQDGGLLGAFSGFKSPETQAKLAALEQDAENRERLKRQQSAAEEPFRRYAQGGDTPWLTQADADRYNAQDLGPNITMANPAKAGGSFAPSAAEQQFGQMTGGLLRSYAAADPKGAMGILGDVAKTQIGNQVGGDEPKYAAGFGFYTPNQMRGLLTPGQGATAAPTAPVAPSMLETLRLDESGGNNNARNPRSTATGPFQFIDSTWMQYAPRVADTQGMTPQQILTLKTNPEVAEKAAALYAQDNGSRISSFTGQPAQPWQLALAHRFDAGGALKIMDAASKDPNTPMSSVFGADVIRANPELGRASVGQVLQTAQQRYSGQAQVQPQQAMQPQPTQQQVAPPAVLASAGSQTGLLGLRRGPGGTLLVPDKSAESPLGKAYSDLQRGLITKDQYDAIARDATKDPNAPRQQSPTEIEAKLRDDFQQNPVVKDFRETQKQFASIIDASGRDTRAADLNMVYGLAKLLDPGSVVREGETVMVRDAQQLPGWLSNAISKVSGGGALMPELRKQVLEEANGRFEQQKDSYKQYAEGFRGIAQRSGVNPDNVVLDLESGTVKNFLTKRQAAQQQKQAQQGGFANGPTPPAAAMQITPAQAAAELARRRQGRAQ